jgi:tetratricopeptide (TPR) repeat protein
MRVGELDRADDAVARAAKAAAPLGPNNYKTGGVRLIEARLRIAQGRAQDGLAAALRAQDAFVAGNGNESDVYGDALLREASALLALGKPRDAEDRALRGLAIRDAISTDAPSRVDDLTIFARIELQLDKPADAVKAIERALAIAGDKPRYPGELAETRFVAARALRANKGDLTRATELARRARDELAKVPFRAALLAEVDAFLAGK